MKAGFATRVFISLFACVALWLSGCSKSSTGGDDVIDDGVAPTTVSDLTITNFTDTSVTLTWTASGDDSTSGTATSYDLRVSAESIHWGNFDSAIQITGLPAPKPGGEFEQFEVKGLTTDSTYYFALKVTDENGNYEGISNCAHATCFNDFVVSIPDPGLLSAIRGQLSKPTGNILKSDMLSLIDLLADDRSIIDLTGLEQAVNLRAVNIVNNSVTDLTPLAGLDKLEQLQAGQNMITDLSALAGLSNLSSLGLRVNEIATLTALGGLTHLSNLDLQENAIGDISPLQTITSLTNLNLSYNGISDIGPLVSNSGLGTGDNISLIQNPLEHESVMAHIPALRSRGASVSWTDNTYPPGDVSDLTVDTVSATSVTLFWSAPGEDYYQGTAYRYELQYSTNQSDLQSWTGGHEVTGLPDPDTAGTVQSFEVTGLMQDTTYYFALRTQDNSENWSDVSNIAFATPYADEIVVFADAALETAIRADIAKPSGDIYRSELADLDSLTADDKGIADLTGLEYCVSLRYLHLTDNNITNVDQLAGLLAMYDLNIMGNSIADISPLSELSNLRILQVSDNPLGSFDDLAPLDQLWHLSASFVGASDLHPLESLTELQYLFAMGNGITDISSVSYLTHLTGLFLDANSIENLSVLSGLQDLTWVSLKYNLIQDISPLVSNSGLGTGDKIELDSNPLSAESINTHIPALQARGVTVTF